MQDNPYAPPTAATSERPQLPETSLLVVFLLTLVTFGLYYVYWLYQRGTLINAWAGRELAKVSMIFALLLAWGMLIFVSLFQGYQIAANGGVGVEDPLNFIQLADFAVRIGSIVAVFHVRGAFHRLLRQHGQASELGALQTFLFGTFYFQYRINRGLLMRVYDGPTQPPGRAKKKKRRRKRKAATPS